MSSRWTVIALVAWLEATRARQKAAQNCLKQRSRLGRRPLEPQDQERRVLDWRLKETAQLLRLRSFVPSEPLSQRRQD